MSKTMLKKSCHPRIQVTPVVNLLFAHGGSNVVAERRDFQIMQPNERRAPAGKRVGNKILLSIPDKEYTLIRPHLEFLSMPNHLSLYEPGQPLKFVHFPNTGIVSLVIP